jgi:hypothetical protein
MYELDKVPDEAHDGESYGDGSAELDVFWIGPKEEDPGDQIRSNMVTGSTGWLTLLRRLGTSVDELFIQSKELIDAQGRDQL